MKTRMPKSTLAALLGIASTANLRAQTSAFTYQGLVTESGSPADGSCDLEFRIYDTPTDGTLVAGPTINAPTAVSNGLFTVTLDFGSSVFDAPTVEALRELRTEKDTAIQGLNQKLEQKETEITELKQTVADLKRLVEEMNRKQDGGAK